MANNDVQHLLDMLYEMIDGAKNAPLTSDKCILNRDEALDLLDEIRAQLPVELSRAQELIRAKEDYVKAAKRDVERMMQQAEQDAKNKVSETEVLGMWTANTCRRTPTPPESWAISKSTRGVATRLGRPADCSEQTC